MLLVGDSLGMCVYGFSGTVPLTMDTGIGHCQAGAAAALALIQEEEKQKAALAATPKKE